MSDLDPFGGSHDDRPIIRPHDPTSEGGPTSPSWLPSVAAIVTSAALVGVLWLRWVDAHVGDRVLEIRGLDLVVFRWLQVLAAVVILGVALVDGRRSEERCSHLAGFLAASWCVVILVTVTVVESTASLIPDGDLPESIRRFTVDLVAAPGLWITAGVLGIGGLAIAGLLDDSVALVGGRLRSLPRSGVVGFWLLVGGVSALVAARYQPTASAAIADSGLRLTGPATPYYGPWTLVAVWALAAVVILTVLRPSVTAAFVGVIVAAATAVVAVVAGMLAKVISAVPIRGHMPDRLAGYEPHVTAGRGAWLVLAASLVAGVGCALLYVAVDRDRAPGN